MRLPPNVTVIDADHIVIDAWSKYYSRDLLVKSGAEIRNVKNDVGGSKIVNNVGARSLKVFQKNGSAINLIEGNCLQYLQAERCFRKNTLLFLDPPYPLNTRSSNHRYKFDFTDEDHKLLLSLIVKVRTKVLICSYTNPPYEDALRNWNKITYTSKIRSGMRTETAYFNYDVPDRLQDYSFVGNDYRERERIKRKIDREVSKFRNLPPLERNAIIDEINKTFDN